MGRIHIFIVLEEVLLSLRQKHELFLSAFFEGRGGRGDVEVGGRESHPLQVEFVGFDQVGVFFESRDIGVFSHFSF